MIQPKSYKLVCKKCNYKKIIRPKSDALNPADTIPLCPKCRGDMKRVEFNKADKILGFLNRWF